jgi:hypothetical protein
VTSNPFKPHDGGDVFKVDENSGEVIGLEPAAPINQCPGSMHTKTCSQWLFMPPEKHSNLHRKCWFLKDCNPDGTPIGWTDYGDGCYTAIIATVINKHTGTVAYRGPFILHYHQHDGSWTHKAFDSNFDWVDGTFEECCQIAYATKLTLKNDKDL